MQNKNEKTSLNITNEVRLCFAKWNVELTPKLGFFLVVLLCVLLMSLEGNSLYSLTFLMTKYKFKESPGMI
jgi:hypothetical protein